MATRVYVVAGLISAVTAASVSLAVVRWVQPPAGPSAAPGGGNDTTVSPRPSPTTDAERTADRKYAKQVCLGFLTALRSFDSETVRAFCTPAYRKQVTGPAAAKDSSWEIKTEAMAADGREASFQGTYHSAQEGRRRFVVVVVRQPVGNQERWLVDAFAVVDLGK
jgi:hypothetical protein